MPFTSLRELELNVIWVGGNPMPIEQLDNLKDIIGAYSDSKINIWVDSPQTYEVLVKQLKKHGFKDTHKNLAFCTIGYRDLLIPQSLRDIIETSKTIKVWAGVSDLLRLFIICRPLKQGDRTSRCYIEPDNLISLAFWDEFKDKSIAAVAEHDDDGKEVFQPMHIRGDMLYIDVASDDGKKFAADLSDKTSELVNDPVIKVLFNELLKQGAMQSGLHARDVMATFGMFVQ